MNGRVMKRKAPETSAELLDALAEAFDAVPLEAVEEAKEELRTLGLDPRAVAAELATVARQALAMSPLHWKASAGEERRAALGKLQAVKRRYMTREAMERRLVSILASHSQAEARAAFHKLEGKASDDDLASLLAQLEFLETSDEKVER